MLHGFAGQGLLGVHGAHPPAEKRLLPGTGVLQPTTSSHWRVATWSRRS